MVPILYSADWKHFWSEDEENEGSEDVGSLRDTEETPLVLQMQWRVSSHCSGARK